MIKELEEFKQIIGTKSAIYLTGSRLTGLQDESSDTDFVGFYLPSKKDFVLDSYKKGSTHIQGDSFEGLKKDSLHLISLMKKISPATMQYFIQKPLYVSPEFKPVTDFIYEKQDELIESGKKQFFMGLYGLMQADLSQLTPDKEFQGAKTFGKIIEILLKEYRMAKAVEHHESLKSAIILEGKELEQQREIKKIKQYPTKLIDELEFDKKIQEVKQLVIKTPDIKGDKPLLDKIIELTLLFD